MAREAWTDERLDDLATQVDRRFDQIAQRFDQVDKRFDRVEKKIEALDEKFDRRFDSLQRNTTTWFIAMFSATITLAAAVIAAAALG